MASIALKVARKFLGGVQEPLRRDIDDLIGKFQLACRRVPSYVDNPENNRRIAQHAESARRQLVEVLNGSFEACIQDLHSYYEGLGSKY